MDFRVNLTAEVDQVGNGLAIGTPVPIQIVYQKGRWHATCEAPPVETPPCDTMEQAIIAGARQVATEVQAAVIERPLIAGKITPDSIPRDMF